MKIAFCFSGQLRTGILASTNIIRYIGELLPNITFFCHTWSINSSRPLGSTLIKPAPVEVNPVEADRFKRLYEISDLAFEFEKWTEEHIHLLNTTPWSPMYHSFSKSVRLVKRYGEQTGNKFDLIIKFRPDLILPDRRRLSYDILSTFSSVNFHIDSKLFSENSQPGNQIDDVFFFAKPDVMQQFAGVSDFVKNTGEYNVGKYLDTLAIETYNIQNHGFIIYRDTCTHIDPLNWGECYRCNWRNYS